MTAQTPGRRLRNWLVPAGILLIAALLLTVVILQVRAASQPAAEPSTGTVEGITAAPPAQPDLRQVERRHPDDPTTAGPVDAPIALVVFSDYQCPFCGKWSRDTLPSMLEYAEAGSLRIEWRDLNMYGEPSERAARAAYAAGLQGKFWEFHEALFPEGEQRSADHLSAERLQEVAAQIGVDADRFAADMDSPAVRDQVAQTAAEGRALGVTGTPAFILDGRPVVGAQPTSVFVDFVEEALAAKD